MRKQSSASDLLAYLRLAVAPADDAAMLTALAIPARGFGAGGVAVKYLKQAAAQRGGVGALLAAAQVRCLCICKSRQWSVRGHRNELGAVLVLAPCPRY